mgnify:CR=1 FL=1
MKLFITGGSGFLGSVCIEKLLQDERVEKIYALTHKTPQNIINPKIEIIQGNVKNLHEITINDEIDSCMLLSGAINGRAINGRAINGRATRNVNYGGTLSAINFCKRNNIPRIILTSSINVRLPKRGAYAQSKLDAEGLVKNSGLEWLIFRPSLIYGRKCKFGLHVIEKSIRKLGIVPIFGNGEKLEQPIHVDECAEYVNYFTLNRTNSRIIELLGRDAMSYNELCRTIAKCMNKNVKLLHLPIWPFTFTLRMIEALNIGFPVSSEQFYHVDNDLAGDMSAIYSETGIAQKSFVENYSRDGICGD